jgi:hypothetical protein
MSNKREPLLSDNEVDAFTYTKVLGHPTQSIMEQRWTPRQVRNIYEAARAKDAELIQQLVDALDANSGYGGPPISASMLADYALIAAADAGFKPSDE